MAVVIENLILKTDDRTGADRPARGFVSLRNGRLNKSFDPAIASGVILKSTCNSNWNSAGG